MTEPRTMVSAEAAVLSYLLYRGQFEVPWHQRYYDWTTEEVRELLEDIDEAIRAGRGCYFLGAVMLVDRPGAPTTWEINDGQQRMVTFSLMCARLARVFTNGADARREALALRVLFLLDENHTQTLEGAGSMMPRLSPPRDDQSRYNSLIRGDDIGTNGKLTAAWQEIDGYLADKTLEQARRFFDFVLNKLEVACLHVPRSIDPNAVFETLNARGRPLDNLDLIRNHLYSFFGEEEDRARKETVHGNLESIRGHLRYVPRTAEYMRCFFQCRYGPISSKRLYRETKKRISEEYRALPPGGAVDSFVYDLVGDLSSRERVELFHQITVPREDDEPIHRFLIDSRQRQKPRNMYAFLVELKNYKVAQPIVFALLDRYIRASLPEKRAVAAVVHRKMRLLSSFVMRTAFVTRKFEPSQFERAFSDLARRLMSAGTIESVPLTDTLRGTDELGVFDDRTFIQQMSEASFHDNTKARRFLLGLAHYQQRGAIVINERRFTVEHILPASPTHLCGWPNFNGDTHRDYSARIGNVALLSEDDNKPGAAANESFARKQTAYERSAVELTRKVAESADWSPGEIEDRQRRLAELAARVWELPSA